MEELIDGLVETEWERDVDMGISKLSFDLDIQQGEFYGYSMMTTPIGVETHRFTWNWAEDCPSTIVLYWSKEEMKGDELYKVIDIVDLTSNRLETADGMRFYRAGSTPSNKIDDYIFVHPLGLQQDIREINPLKFEGFLKSKGINYKKTEKDPYYIEFWINNPLTNINGVKLPVTIWFYSRDCDREDILVKYGWNWSDYVEKFRYKSEKDRPSGRAFEDAEKIVEYLKQCGFQTYKCDNIREYEHFEYGNHNSINIYIGNYGVELFCTIYF